MTIVFLVYVILYYALTYAMNSNYQQHACKWIMGYPNMIRTYKIISEGSGGGWPLKKIIIFQVS